MSDDDQKATNGAGRASIDGWQPALLTGLILTAVAGFLDALGYVQLNHLYISFMSGNSTRFGMALVAGDVFVSFWAGSVIVAFVTGAFLGGVMTSSLGRARLVWTLGFEIILISSSALFSMLGLGRAGMLPAVIAMGIQNSMHQSVFGTDTGKSFVTGALYGVGNCLAQYALGRKPAREAGINLLSWFAFALGVVLGALALMQLGLACALLAVIVVLAGLAAKIAVERSLAASY